MSKMYKRKSKKVRNSAIQAPNTRRKKMREAHVLIKTQEEEGYNSDSSSVFEEEVVNKEVKPEVVVQEEPQGIKDMLRDAGVLKE